MNLKLFMKQTEKFTVDNSPLLLTAIGVAGVATTALLTHRAAIKADRLLYRVERDRRIEPLAEHSRLTTKEKIQLTWIFYIPPVTSAALSCGAIIGAHQIGNRRAAAMAAAYALSERAFSEYKEKVVEKIGETKERGIRDGVAQSQMDGNPLGNREVFITGTGEQLCYDAYSGRYFQSDMESIKHAMNRLNHQINSDTYASLTDFYNYVGLARTSQSDEVGWNGDRLLDIHFSTTMADDNRPAISITYSVEPIRNYFRGH